MILRCFSFVLFALGIAAVGAQEVIPPAPAAYFNDYASLVRPETAATLNSQLEQFERATSTQILVVTYPRMQSDSSIEDYTVRVAEAWKVGMKGKDNGAVLFVFAASHQIYLSVGYGLEGTIPDATAQRIISEEITPAFRRGDVDGGLSAGVAAILAAAKGEYHGTGHTVRDGQRQGTPPIAIGFTVVLIIIVSLVRRRAAVYGNRGRSGFGGMIVPLMFSGGGGGGFGGGGSGGGGGGFSGGGGSFGGGGAGGSW